MKTISTNVSNNTIISGFTLMEVMVVIAIIGIVSATGMYSFLNSMPNRKVKAASRDLYEAFQEANIQALNRDQNVTLTLNPVLDSFTINDANGNNITQVTFANDIDLYNVTAPGNTFTYTPRGMLTGVSASALLQYAPNNNAAIRIGVRATTTGGIALVDDISEAGDFAW